MGSLNFTKGDFADHLHELIGYKAGIAVSIEQMCDLLLHTSYSDDIVNSEKYGLRIRSEDYESLYYNLLHKVGVTDKPYGGMFEIFDLTSKHRMLHGDKFSEEVFEIYQSNILNENNMTIKDGEKYVDPTIMIKEAEKKLGVSGVAAIVELIQEFDKLQNYNPHNIFRWKEWNNIVSLSDLFKQYKKVGDSQFFDQRFINFLSVNQEKLGKIHWRKFEELIAECFIKFGYKVELGPGSNDDGVDVRVWKENENSSPEFIIQCKKQKEKINKVTIKGLYADVLHENAKQGLLVTTSELSIGATKTIKARAYPIAEVNGDKVKNWLVELRKVGSGIVRV